MRFLLILSFLNKQFKEDQRHFNSSHLMSMFIGTPCSKQQDEVCSNCAEGLEILIQTKTF